MQHQFLLCTLHQISLCSTAPNFSLLCSTKFSLLCSTKFLLCSAAPNSLCCAAPNFSCAQQHQIPFAICLLLYAESSMLHSHTGINPGLEAQSNFVSWCVEHHIKNLWHLALTIKVCQINDYRLSENCLLFKI